ncbi:MAG: VWA domain-containing protein [Phycisphaeraceae bacterium]|nr:VWA domain-containing protein [Phycisphaeraceae bacterium]
MGVSFAQPLWLLTLLLAAPCGVIAIRWFASMSRVRRWSAVVLRTLLLALVSGLLAGASIVRTTDRLAVVVVVDVSDSVRLYGPNGRDADGRLLGAVDLARSWIERVVAQRGADDLVGVVVFDGRAISLAAPSMADPLERWTDVRSSEGSDLGSAIARAASLIPPDAAGRIVVISDGNDTSGMAIESARRAAGDRLGKVPIDVVPLEYAVTGEVVMESLDAPPTAMAESPVTLRVTLRSAGESSGTLYITREGEPVDLNGEAPGVGQRVRLEPGISTVLVQAPLEAGRIHRFQARYEPDPSGAAGGYLGDRQLSNNSAEAFTLTPGVGTVLIVDGAGDARLAGPEGLLARTLSGQGIRTEMVSPVAMPGELLSLQSYDLIVLQNVPAEALSRAQHALLATFVQDLGGGLVMIGGPDSFGAGGWKGTLVEAILPVKLDLPEQLVQPEAAVVFVLDSSGSMGIPVMGSARTKQQIANESAALAVQTLDEQDLVGVIAFSGSTDVIVPLDKNGDPRATASKILSIGAGGGTNLGPALRAAQRQLAAVDAKIKHVIALTDGRSMNSESLPGIAEEMRAQGIRLTTIGVGDDADDKTLEEMAALGGGKYHQVLNPGVLPRVFLRAVRVVRQPLIREAPFRPLVRDGTSPLLGGDGAFPTLEGLVLTQRRDEPTVVTALVTAQGEPVLAHWNVGLGRVVAFTSDADGEWSRRWVDWPGYRDLWTRIARFASRAPGSGRFDLAVRHEGNDLRVRMDAFNSDGTPRDLLSVPATVYLPEGESVEATLSQIGPGVYEGSVPVRGSGNAIVIAKPREGGVAQGAVVGGVSVASGLETRRLRSDRALLEQIARESDGRVMDVMGPATGVFSRDGVEPRRALTPIWRSLLLWTIVVFLLDVGTRRIAWDRLVSKEFGADVRAAAAEAVAVRSGRAMRAVSRLRRRATDVTSGTRGAETALGEREAREVSERTVRQQETTRLAALREARKRALGGLAAQESGGGARHDEPTETKPVEVRKQKPEAPPGEGTGGLLAAKRRARERMGGGETEDENKG